MEFFKTYLQSVATSKQKLLSPSQSDGTVGPSNNGTTKLNGDMDIVTGMNALASFFHCRESPGGACSGTQTSLQESKWQKLRKWFKRLHQRLKLVLPRWMVYVWWWKNEHESGAEPASAYEKPRALDSLPGNLDRLRARSDPTTEQELAVTVEVVGANGTLERNAVASMAATPPINMKSTGMGCGGNINKDVSLDLWEDFSLLAQKSLSIDVIDHSMKDLQQIPPENGLAHSM